MHPTNTAGRLRRSFCRTTAAGFLASIASLPLPVHATSPATLASLSNVAVPFIANEGQVDDRVAYYARTFAATIFVTRSGQVVYSIGPRGPAAGETGSGGWSFAETLVGANLAPHGKFLSPTKISSLIAGKKQVVDAPTFERVDLGEITPGISAELRATGNNIEKIFHVDAGMDARMIRVQLAGAKQLSTTDGGGLVIVSDNASIEFTAPIAYQERNGFQRPVKVAYALSPESLEYGFSLGDYDPSLPLTIDPLIRSTYSGGSQGEDIRAMALHPGSGDVFVAGWTTSADFPGTAGQLPKPVQKDAFIAQYSANLGSLVRAVYYGGGGDDVANAIAISPSSGHIYIAGTTSSPALPVGNTAGVVQPLYRGGNDAFVARFDGGLALLSATYYGGSGAETGAGIAIDRITGDVILVGDTLSGDLAIGASGAQTTPHGNGDAYAVRFDATLALLNRGTYFGGSAYDQALCVAVDPVTSDIFVGGLTYSTDLNGAANGALAAIGGLSDGFVARFDGGLTTLRQSTYFGGSGSDQINAIAVHPITGQIYVTGDTNSPDLRGKLGGQVAWSGGVDAFVARFVPELTGLLSVTYFGGTGDEHGWALAIDRYTGEIYIAGQTLFSPTLPGTANGIQTTNAGNIDSFVARYDRSLSGIKQATFIGGVNNEVANAIALTQTAVYIAGTTGSPSFPGTSIASAQQNPGGGPLNDGFISQMTSDLRLVNSSPANFSFAPIINALPSTVQISAPALINPTGTASAYVDGQPGSKWCASTGVGCACDLTGGTFLSGSQTLPAGTPYYVCVQHTAAAAPNIITESTMHIGAQAAIFRVGTGAIAGFGCTLDVDGNGVQNALTDGLLIIRALFGLTGTPVTNGAIGVNATRTSWSDVSGYLNTNCGSNFSP